MLTDRSACENGAKDSGIDVKTRTEAARRYPTPALEKGLDALELLASEPEGLTKTEVARRLGRTVSEVFRMLVCLEARGYIARSGDERYSLTFHLFKLAHQHPPIERLMTEAVPIMRHVTDQINQSCHLGVLDGDRVVIIAQVNPPLSSSGFYVKAGGIGDLMRSTTGQVILAHQTPEVSSRAIKLWCKHNSMRPPRDLDEDLTTIKAHGFDERESYEVKGVINISFPVFDDRGYAVAGLSVPFLQRIGDSTTPTAVKRVLGKASRALSEAIGGVANPKESLSQAG
jgi:DNA-binding IclR family transcriptional regulator